MEKIAPATLFIFLILLFTQCTGSDSESIPDHHTSEISLDWDVTYTGVLPCADCEGVETTIRLFKNHTYMIQRVYLGKSEEVFTNAGDFKWNDAGSTIILSNITDAPNSYFVGENHIVQLDMEGKRVTGDLAMMYVLIKKQPETDTAALFGTKWILTELRGNSFSEASDSSNAPHFILDFDDQRITGNGGCNGFFGSFNIGEGNRISFSDITSTLMACGDMETERSFFDVMEMTDSYHLKGDTLQLFRARMAPLAVLVKIED